MVGFSSCRTQKIFIVARNLKECEINAQALFVIDLPPSLLLLSTQFALTGMLFLNLKGNFLGRPTLKSQ